MWREVEVIVTINDLTEAGYTVHEHSVGLFGVHYYVMTSDQQDVKLMVNPNSMKVLRMWVR